jgi:hypothetical protein
LGVFFVHYDVVCGMFDVIQVCQFFYGLSGFRTPDNEPEYMQNFYFYIGIASISLDFQQPGCPGAADPSFTSTFDRQMTLVLATGLPILIIMPALIYVPRLVHTVLMRRARQSGRSVGRKASVMVDDEHLNLARGGRLNHVAEAEYLEALLRFSAHWQDRFWFAVMIWMWFVAFISAQAAIQATPVPTLSCTGDNVLVADPSERCFSDSMAKTHFVALVVTFVFVLALPYLLHRGISHIRYLEQLEDDKCNLKFGYFYGGLRQGWETCLPSPFCTAPSCPLRLPPPLRRFP